MTSYTFTNVTADHTISATFAIDTFTITPSAGANGTISPARQQPVDYGGRPGVHDHARLGYHVEDVLVDGASIGPVTSHTFSDVTADHTISVTFAIDTFTITPTPGVNGKINPSTPQGVAFGGNLTFTITANAGYYVADVSVDGDSVGPVTTYSFLAVDADHTIAASFAFGAQAALDISFGRTVVTYGGSTLLGGGLYDAATGTGLGGRTVMLERATSANGPWSPSPGGTFITSTDADSLGRFTTTVSPEGRTWYRLRYVAVFPFDYGSATGGNSKLDVRPALGRPAVPSSIRARRYFTVSGSLKPHFEAGQKTVKVKVYRYRNGRYVLVKTLAATNVDADAGATKYRLRTRLTGKGKYRFRATAAPSGWATTTTSYSRTLVVR